MATRGKKISEQTLAASLDGNEIIPFAKNGADGAVKASKIKEYVQPDLTAKQDKLVNSDDVTIGIDNKLTVTDLAKKKAFIDQWKSLSNLYTGLTTEYDVATDKFLLHWNYNNQEAKKYEPKVTYEQAMAMVAGIQNSVLGYSSFSITAPANLPPIGYHAGSGPYLYIDHPDVCLYNPNIQVLIFATQKNGIVTTYKNPVRLTNLLGLKAVIGVFRSAEPNIHGLEFVKGTGPGFPKLEFFRVQIKQSFDVRTSPLLTLDTMQYLVNYAQNTSPITVTVHPDVYAKLTGDTTNAAASALTADELAQWQALVTTANSKNISFATTSN